LLANFLKLILVIDLDDGAIEGFVWVSSNLRGFIELKVAFVLDCGSNLGAGDGIFW
jgi:hypothetical protein